MDATHLHLVLSHFPIIGTIIGVVILAYGLMSKNIDIQKVALVTFVLMALFAIPVFLTGEGAEDTVENFNGVSKQIIEEHEELAEKAIWLMGFLGILSVISFYALFKKLKFAKTITLITLIISLVTFGVFAQVGSLGGQIRHTEIVSGATNTNMNKYQTKDNKRINKADHNDD